MKEKTAMQQLIDWYEQNYLDVILNADTIKQKAQELLSVERQQIEAAVDYCDKMFCDLGYVPTGKQYFTETYGE